ncbi:MAG: hypothetical protein NC421_00400 [Lachnospiraceae bacterium]|nr:hypothetical protein [Lachnospiraceae bacterium]
MRNIFFILIFLMSPALSFANDFNYDDDTKIDVTEGEWEKPNPDVNVGFDSDISGIDFINKDNNLHGAASKKSIMVTPKNGNIVINSSIEQIIPLYSLGTATVKMLRVLPGTNVFPLTHGIYIIAGKKYML